MLNAAIRDCPVFGGKVKSVDAAAVMKRPGVKKVVRVGDSAVAVVADTWWHAKTALDALPIEWDYGPNANASSAAFAEVLKAGLDAKDAVVGNQVGDARGGDRRGAAQDRGGVLVPAPEPRDDGDDERDGALDAGALRGVDADAERRGGARRGRRGRRAAARQVRGLQAAAGRRLRPPRRGARLGAPGRRDRQGDARHAGQADLVARRGHDARPLPPGHAVQADRGARRAGQHHRPAHAHLGPVDPGRRVPAERQGRQGSGRVPGPQSAGTGSVDRLHVPGAADRPRDAQSARAARLLARREPEPERDLPRVLHRRDRARDGAGSAGAAAQADGEAVRSTSRC